MARADFHTHSTHSDGVLPPEALIARAAARGVQILALTDHDTTEGIPAAIAAGTVHGVRIVPGVELSTDLEDGGDAHILGYFGRVDHPGLQEHLMRLRSARGARGQTMLEKLAALDMPLDWEAVTAIAGEAAVGRPHVARAMVDRGYVASIREAFDRYLHSGGPADAPREKLTPEEAVALIREQHGIAVLAHPAFLPDPQAAASRLAPLGLQGIEVYYKNWTDEEIATYRALAEKLDLLPLGGSDYHGIHDDEREPGDIPLPDDAIDAFLALGASCWAAPEAEHHRQ